MVRPHGRRFPGILATLGMVLAAGIAPAAATEAGAGHYIIGSYAAPAAGIVPPQPGVYWANVNLYYGADASGSLTLPIAGNLVTGLRGDFSNFALSGIYVPKLDWGPFTFATGVTLPAQYLNSRGAVGGFSRSDNSGGFGDMIITPAILGWHSGGHFFQARVDIFAPTGPYKVGSLANIGMNYWTFTPTVAYTYLDPHLGIDVSGSLGIDFNTPNESTNYQSGTLLHLDTSVTKSIGTTGLSLGLLGSMLYQIGDDSGGLAARLGGFRGQAFAVGPVASYAFKLGRMETNSSLRWAPEFAVEKRLSGHAVYLSFSGRF
jgi:hypothetical protein